MSKVLAKFRITSLESQRHTPYANNPETGKYERQAPVEGCHVKLAAVQGEPFGSATPQGLIDLTILNPAAARAFREAWGEYVTSADPQTPEPEFFVTFSRDDPLARQED